MCASAPLRASRLLQSRRSQDGSPLGFQSDMFWGLISYLQVLNVKVVEEFERFAP